ncbi:hypothetical protein PoB_006586100 [Plakobranchus ocellatus]|uniref:Uncharacterized protein n=1 Tax=Plakobranchus ocellatus TaxID=259542 RepID=A0AAV4D5B9_9GAST|nr:hypothetical protein PoB_006586100 [Plakobranchus ocellatus]
MREGPPPSSCWQQRQHHALFLCKASSPRRDMARDRGGFFFKVMIKFLKFGSRRQDDSTGKEARREDKARWRESDVAHVLTRGSSWATTCFSRLLRHSQYGGSVLSQTPHGKRKK